MEKTPLDYISRREIDAGNCISAAKSYQEYCDTYIKKFLSFTEGGLEDVQVLSVSIPSDVDNLTSKVVYITREQYEQAISDDSAIIHARINELGATIDVTGEVLSDAIESTLEEIKIQSMFLKGVIDQGMSKAADFINQARSVCQAASGDLLEKYGDLLDSSSAINSLQSFFTTANTTTLVKRNPNTEAEYIEVVSPSDYASVNVWQIAIMEVGQTIAGFFNVVWQGILKIGEFFKSIINGFVKLLKWIAQKAFKNLFTNYSQGEAFVGFMDYPFLQCELGSLIFDYDNRQVSMSTSYFNNICGTIDQWNYSDQNFDLFLHMFDNKLCMKLRKTEYGSNMCLLTQRWKTARELIMNRLFSLVDGEFLPRVLDVVIPLDQYDTVDNWYQYYPVDVCDVLIRIGLCNPVMDTNAISGHKVCKYTIELQCFLIDSWENYSQYNDYQNAMRIWYTSYYMIKYIASNYCCIPYYSKDVSMGILKSSFIEKFADSIINHQTILTNAGASEPPDEPVGLAEYLPWVYDPDNQQDYPLYHMFDNWDTHTTLEKMQSFFPGVFLIALICHCAITCTDDFVTTNVADSINWNDINFSLLHAPFTNINTSYPRAISKTRLFFALTYSVTSPVGNQYENEVSMDPPADYTQPFDMSTQADLCLNYQLTLNNVFKPFNCYDHYLVSIHYQTTREQISEAKLTIWCALAAIAAVTVIATVKRFVKKRKAKAAIARGYADNLAWNLPSHPSASDVKQYIKADKKANRISKVNALMGINSPFDTISSNSNLLTRLSSQLFATQGTTDENRGCSLSDIKTLISG